MSTRKAKFDSIENALVDKIKQAGAKDAAVAEVLGQFYPRAWVWARRASATAFKLGEKTQNNTILYEVVIESVSAAPKTAYDTVKTIYFNFVDLLWSDPTLGGNAIRALPAGFERISIKTGDQFLEQWAATVEVIAEI